MESRSDRLRILMVSPLGEMGGAERSFLELICAMPRDRIDIQACVPDGALAGNLTSAGIKVHPLPPLSLRRSLDIVSLARQFNRLRHASRTLARLSRELKVDLVHANTNTAALAVWGAQRFARKFPYIWHCRDIRQMHGLARILSRSAASVVAISNAVRCHLLDEGVSEEKLVVIENGIDLTRLHPENVRPSVRIRTRAALGLTADQPVLLSVGASVPWKRQDLFLRTLAMLRSRIPSLVGIWAGSDQFNRNRDHAAELQRLAENLNLNDTVLKILHERQDVPDLMAASDVLLSCSENEPFGRVLAEAGASGLAVVSTASGGKTEIIENGVTGQLVAPGNLECLAAACERLLIDEPLARSLGENARQRVARLFDVRRTANELTLLIEKLDNV